MIIGQWRQERQAHWHARSSQCFLTTIATLVLIASSLTLCLAKEANNTGKSVECLSSSRIHDDDSLFRTAASETGRTTTGYDNDEGVDPVCWVSVGTTSVHTGLNDTGRYPWVWHTTFAHDFFSQSTRILRECPSGFDLVVEGPSDEERDELGRLFVGRTYNFNVKGRVSVPGLRGSMNLGPEFNIHGEEYECGHNSNMRVVPRISLQVIMCRVLKSGGLCDPFVYQKDVHGDSHVYPNDGSYVHYDDDDCEDESKIQQSDEDADEPWHELGATEHQNKQEHGTDEIKASSYDESLHTSHEDSDLHFESDHSFDDISHSSHDDNDSHSESDHSFLQSDVLMFDAPHNASHIDIDQDIVFSFKEAESVFAIAVVRFLISNMTATNSSISSLDYAYARTYKFDASNIVDGRVLTIYEVPTVKSVSLGIEVLSYVMIALSCGLLLWLLVVVLAHRQHNVFKLSQGTLLLAFLSAGIVTCASAFLLNLKSDVYCKLKGPLILIPLQFMVSIITGRLLRVIWLMKPLISWADNRTALSKAAVKQGAKMLPSWLGKTSTSASDGGDAGIERTAGKSRRFRSRNHLKKTFSTKQVILIVSLMTLPQVLAQILLVALAPLEQDILWNEDRSVGRYHCHGHGDLVQWFPLIYLGATILTLLAVAYQSRNLPSLFNEAGVMFTSTVATVAMAAVGIPVVIVTEEPTSNPSVPYIITVFIVLVCVVTTSTRLIYPKIQIVWSGEKVTVGELIQRRSAEVSTTSWQNSFASSFTKGSFLWRDRDSRKAEDTQCKMDEAKAKAEPSDISSADPKKSVTFSKDLRQTQEIINNDSLPTLSDDNSQMKSHPDNNAGGRIIPCVSPVLPTQESSVSAPDESEQMHETIVIRESDPPSHTVILRMLRLSEQVSKASHRMLSGYNIEKEEWNSLRSSLVGMGHLFEEDVLFEWESVRNQLIGM